MGDGRRRFARMRSVLEVPILNEHYWSKVPTTAADAIMVDLEDSAVPVSKARARDAAVHWLSRPEFFGGRPVIVRMNNLSTPWAADDLAALAAVPGDFLVCYPKVQTAQEMQDVSAALAAAGSPPRGLHVMIETARALLELDQIAQVPGVDGLHYGYVDLAAQMGSRAFDENGLYEPTTHYPRMKIAAAAASHGHFVTGGSLLPDYRDLGKVRRLVELWRDSGFTACIAVSPSHVDLINAVMSPDAALVRRSTILCQAYEAAVARGEPAAVLDGRVVTMPDYRSACRVLERAGEPRPPLT